MLLCTFRLQFWQSRRIFRPKVRKNVAQFPIHFLLFLSAQNVFLGLFFGIDSDNLPRFCVKYTKLHTQSLRVNIQKNNFLRKAFFPLIFLLVLLNSVLTTVTELKGFGKNSIFYAQLPFLTFPFKQFVMRMLLWKYRFQCGPPALNFWQKISKIMD